MPAFRLPLGPLPAEMAAAPEQARLVGDGTAEDIVGVLGMGSEHTGVHGRSREGSGVTGQSSTETGVFGWSAHANGVVGSTHSKASGVYGENGGAGFGVAGRCTTKNGVGVLGTGGRV